MKHAGSARLIGGCNDLARCAPLSNSSQMNGTKSNLHTFDAPGEPRARMLGRTSLIAALLFSASAAFAQPVLITAPTTIGPQDATIAPTKGGPPVPLSSAEITVQATTLTINGRHTIASLSLVDTAVLTHSGATTFDYAGDGTDVIYGMSLTVLGDVSIPALSRVDVSGVGYAGSTGPGAGMLGGGSCGGGGGSFGG